MSTGESVRTPIEAITVATMLSTAKVPEKRVTSQLGEHPRPHDRIVAAGVVDLVVVGILVEDGRCVRQRHGAVGGDTESLELVHQEVGGSRAQIAGDEVAIGPMSGTADDDDVDGLGLCVQERHDIVRRCRRADDSYPEHARMVPAATA